MSIFDKFKKPFEKVGKDQKQAPGVSVVKKTDKDSSVKKKESSEKENQAGVEVQNKIKVSKGSRKIETKLRDLSGHASGIIIRPLQTEKGTDLTIQSKYLFEVIPGATKSEVKKAIFGIYNVKPISVNMISVSGKAVRFGRITSKRKNKKKAIVTLKLGEKIEVFEGV